MALTERIYISEFNILPSHSIAIRKTTEILRDEEVISESYWRCVLQPHDPQAESVLGDEPYYLHLAEEAWKDAPVPEPEPEPEPEVVEPEPEPEVVEPETEESTEPEETEA
jgi:hypothetical protein